jgi:DNA-binding beta-propeller fold protein YncE/thiol-disulfide isomerase/thioredoxin
MSAAAAHLIHNALFKNVGGIFKNVVLIAGMLAALHVASPARGQDVEHPFPKRIPFPGFEGGTGWINVKKPLDPQQLKGKFVVLDFWTYCCINCMHILPELKKLEHAYPNNVVVVGVHSYKFEGENDLKNVTDAVLRYEIEHPVVLDSEHVLWKKYFVDSWPSIRIIDPEGFLVEGGSGEVPFEKLDAFMKQHLPYYRAKGVLDETPLKLDLALLSAERTPLRFPGKILADEATDQLFIADSNHERIVVASLSGELKAIVGNGRQGQADGNFANASFNHPQGMALVKNQLYVADTENHRLRKIDFDTKKVTTVAGTGKQGAGWPGLEEGGKPHRKPVGRPLATALNSPWAITSHGNSLYIAMAGSHQIWRMNLDGTEIGLFAGNSREDIVDGPPLPGQLYQDGFASFAQPSGISTDGQWLYVADSEGSSIRAVPLDLKKQVRTVLGTSALPEARLFTFGDVDGKWPKARLQHCLDVLSHDDKLYIADTYNNKIKVLDPKTEELITFVGSKEAGHSDSPARFDEPAGITYAQGKLFIADTNNHLIRTIDIESKTVGTLEIRGLEPPLKTTAK